MKSFFIPALQKIIADLTEVLQSFSAKESNRVFYSGSSSAAQVADHVIKCCAGLPKMLAGGSIVNQRNYEENVQKIEFIFLEFITKMQSPEFILPADKFFKTDNLQHALNKLLDKIVMINVQKDFNRTYSDFPFLQMGFFTGKERLCFSLEYTTGHLRKIKNIHQCLQIMQY